MRPARCLFAVAVLAVIGGLTAGASAASPAGGDVTTADVVVNNADSTLAQTDQVNDAEPVLAVNRSNPNEIVIQSAAQLWTHGACGTGRVDCPDPQNADKAPIWLSEDAGRTWAKKYVIPLPPGVPGDACTCDRVADFDRHGRLIEAILHSRGIFAASSTDPGQASSWSYPVGADGAAEPIAPVRDPSETQSGEYPDQPWIALAPGAAAADNAYVGYSVSTASCCGAGPVHDPSFKLMEATSFDTGSLSFTSHRAVFGFPVCCDGDTVPTPRPDLLLESPAAMRVTADPRTGDVYALFQVVHGAAFTHPDPQGQQFDTLAGVESLNDYYLNRSTDGGRTWGLNGHPDGIVVATALSGSQGADKFATINAVYGGADIAAVDPANGDVYYVYGAEDPVTRVNRLAVVRLTRSGDSLTLGAPSYLSVDHDGALAGIAVADDGTVGVLFDTYEGRDPDGFPIISAWLARSQDHAASFSAARLTQFRSVEKENANDLYQRPLGDYQQLKAAGDRFYGVFIANGQAFGRATPNWDPIFVTSSSDQLSADVPEAPFVPAFGGLAAVVLVAVAGRRRRRRRIVASERTSTP